MSPSTAATRLVNMVLKGSSSALAATASGVKEVSRLLEIDKDTRQIDLRDGQGRISRRFLRQVKNNPCYL